MDILNFISWIKGNRVVTTVNSDQTLIPLGLKDPKRDDGYLAGAISVTDFAAQIGGGGGGIIAEDTGVGSARRIDATNCASGAYSTALGKCNTVSGDNSASLSGLANNVTTCNSSASGINNIVAVTNSYILSGNMNVIACDALPNSQSAGYYFGFVNGVTTISSSYGDLTSYYTPGSTISAQYTYGNPQLNNIDMVVCGSSYDGTATTICVDPAINTCSGYFIKTGTFSTYSAYHPNVIAGGGFNTINGYTSGATISGGYHNTISGGYAAIAGGNYNTICASNSYIGYGSSNTITNGQSSIFTGLSNTITGIGSTIFAGSNNTISGNFSNSAGGVFNTISGAQSTISGGNYNTASANYNTISGGSQNSTNGNWTSIVGGRCNTAIGGYSAILGGSSNTVSNYKSFVVGSDINTNRVCTTFVNNLSIMDIPTSDSGLPTKSVWFDSATCTLKMVP